ncbi:septal ring lytic transglycosylase RlpA family protein [Rhizorhabdus dicambivorans]|uniref:Endolytic peptidoglycan transglycosylase RlpA n=1 Tax=Rhizorhabdus dicambivorans TaxID=1850238 RepID=A0A2A4FXI1_9SPHN|nr:septal ring lytic transglycosylase RlpA family protein [Rhizorhabdus dicambivorans]ATE65272.1 septal ring lytic transglycosylase RlpA family lipoprotein [Rhizorhabdus dicambivorans]PCE42403.1 septal ring lytic transglycosylase RlpA family lipoprotein [Rhizorhabdus dicambivorans]
MASNSRIILALTLFLASCGVPRPERPGPARPRPEQPRPAKPRLPASDMPVKIGKPYQVAGAWYYPADDRDYDEVGLASWYGDQFHGAPTANGEIFDMANVGAAHKTLPLPSYVEVTSLDTGRTILVRVNDRGPFVTNRIIDLSRRAAQLLGTERLGVARVRVRRVYPSEADKLELRWGRPASARPYATPAELAALDRRFAARPAERAAPPRIAAAVPDEAVPVGGLFIQVTAVGNRVRAEEIAELVAGRVEPVGALWRVRMGPYRSEAEATSALAQVRSYGYQDARLVRIASDGQNLEGSSPR